MKLETHDTVTECLFEIGQTVYADKSIGEIVQCKLNRIDFSVDACGVHMLYRVVPKHSSAKEFFTTRIYVTPEEAFK